jgi:hypothetical protein
MVPFSLDTVSVLGFWATMLLKESGGDANPFEALNREDDVSDFFRKALKTLKGGWIFQGKNKHKIKIELTRSEAQKLATDPTPSHYQAKLWAKKKLRNTLDSTTPFLIH